MSDQTQTDDHDNTEESTGPSRAAFDGITSATIVKPGDRVLITVRPNWPPAEVDRLAGRLAGFPDVQFAILTGDATVTVMPQGGTDE